MDKIKWKLVVSYDGEKVKDLDAKKGELEIVEVGLSSVTLEFNGKDVTDLTVDKRRKIYRRIISEAIRDIKSEFDI